MVSRLDLHAWKILGNEGSFRCFMGLGLQLHVKRVYFQLFATYITKENGTRRLEKRISQVTFSVLYETIVFKLKANYSRVIKTALSFKFEAKHVFHLLLY